MHCSLPADKYLRVMRFEGSAHRIGTQRAVQYWHGADTVMQHIEVHCTAWHFTLAHDTLLFVTEHHTCTQGTVLRCIATIYRALLVQYVLLATCSVCFVRSRSHSFAECYREVSLP
jgi:hypothetical protein